MEPITLLKLTRRYPDDGPMVEEWVPAATVPATVELMPGAGLKVALAFRPGLERGLRLVHDGHQFTIDHVIDPLGRGERLVLTCSRSGA